MIARREFLAGSLPIMINVPVWADDDCRGSKLTLAPPLNRMDHLASGGRDLLAPGARNYWEVPEVIAATFGGTVEENIRELPLVALERLLSSMNGAELNDFSYVYNSSANQGGGPHVLLELLAERCGVEALARIGPHFGFAETYAAVARVAPAKSAALALLLPSGAMPARFLSQASTRGLTALAGAGPSPSLDMTIRQIYLDYRTAPVGSLSVTSALYETVSYVGQRLTTSFAAGYAVGAVINNLWSSYAPESYGEFSDLLGRSVDSFMNSVSSLLNGSSMDSIPFSTRRQIGKQQAGLFNSGTFGYLGSAATFYTGGGDFGVSGPWRDDVGFDRCK